MIRLELKNERQFRDMLDKIPKQFQANAVRKILRFSVKPMVQEAQRRAPVSDKPHDFYSGGQKYTIQPGTLSAGLKQWNLKKTKYAGLILGPKVKGLPPDRAPFYAHFVEFGGGTVKKHRGGKFKRKDGSWAGPRTPRPFMRPAWDHQKGNVENRFMTTAIRKFELEVKRLAKKGLV